MIRLVVAFVVFDAVGTPTAGSFQRNEASRDHRRRDHTMKGLSRALCWIVLLTVIAPLGYRATRWLLRYDLRPKTDALASEAGRNLFLHEWTPGDKLAAQGDGLGPVFNASSCVACHEQGGAGGSGSLEHNVTVFTRAPKPDAGATRGVIHQFATDAASQETLHNVSAQFPKKSRPTLTDLQALLPKPANPSAGGQSIRADAVPEIDIGQRNTPSLFGANIIDAIPDVAILANERDQRMNLRLVALNGEQLPAGAPRSCPESESESSVGRPTSETCRSSCGSRAPTSWGSAIPCRPSQHRCRSQIIVPAGSISRTSSAIR